MPALSRRAFIATGTAGAAGVGLAACGAEADESHRSSDADAELVAAAVAAERQVGEAAATAAREGTGEERAVAEQIDETSDQRPGDPLASAADDSGAATDAGSGAATLPDALGNAIAAYREAAALLSTEELRAAALEQVAPVAAELAAMRAAVGEAPSPFAFVTGLDEKPYEAVESDSEETTSDETDTTSTTSTAAEGEG